MVFILYNCIGSFASDLTWGDVDKYEKYVHDHSVIFTLIIGLKVSKLSKSSTIQPTANQSYGHKQGDRRNPGRTIVCEDYKLAL